MTCAARHTRIGVPTDVNVIELTWSRQDDVRAYSVEWADAAALPDTDPDLPGDATGASSPALSAGSWYFSMRTQGTSGEWTSTVHVGPFIVEDEEGSPDESQDDGLPPEVASDRSDSGDRPLDVLLAVAPSLPDTGTEEGDGEAGAGDGSNQGDGDGGDGDGDGGNGDGDGDGDGDGEPPVTPLASVGDARVVEGAGHMSFPVELSSAASRPVSLTFATEPGSASAGPDFVPVTSSVVIPTGGRSGSIPVMIVDDRIDEPDELFGLVLTHGVGAKLGTAATGTIVDDDEPPGASVNDVTVPETGGVAVFTIELSHPSAEAVEVSFETFDGTARVAADYGRTTGTASFPAGVTQVTVSVPIVDDGFDEPDETYTVELFAPRGVNIQDGVGLGTIVDDDIPQPPDPEPTEQPEPEPSGGL